MARNENRTGFWKTVRAVAGARPVEDNDNPVVSRGSRRGARVTVYGAARGGASHRRTR